MSAVMPKEWSNEDDGIKDNPEMVEMMQNNPEDMFKEVPTANDLQCILIDIHGLFCARNFMNKLKKVYKTHRLNSVLGPRATQDQ